jgi:Ca2+-binding RTX toxin-like protein
MTPSNVHFVGFGEKIMAKIISTTGNDIHIRTANNDNFIGNVGKDIFLGGAGIDIPHYSTLGQAVTIWTSGFISTGYLGMTYFGKLKP